MKNTNNGYIGQVSSLSNTQKSGVYDSFDVYSARIDDGARVSIHPGLREPQTWPTANGDPYYDTVRIHLSEPRANSHIMSDRSGNYHDSQLVLTGANKAVAATYFGPRYSHWSALYGESGYIKLNENSNQFQFGTGNFTIEFWIRRQRNESANQFIMAQGTAAGISGGSGWAIYIDVGNRLNFVNATTGNTLTTGSTIIGVDEWTHCAIVRTSTAANGLRFYVNGAQDALGTCGNFHPTGSTSLYFGRDRVATASSFFGGMMTDVRITNSAVYTTAFTPPQQPLDMTLGNVIYHDSVTNRRFYTDTANSPNNIPVTLEAAQIVKIIESPYFVENTKTPQAHGTHSAYCWDNQNNHTYLDLDPNNTSLRFGTGPYTVESWVYLNQRATNNSICGKGQATNGWSFWVDSSQRLRFTSNSTELYNTGTVTSNYVGYGGWYHVAAVRDGVNANQFRLYVNGRLEYTGTDSENYRSQEPLYVFANRTNTTIPNGFFCGIRISKTNRYTANFSVESTAFIDSSMSVDANVSFLTATCGTDKLMPTQSHYIDYGKERTPQVRKGSEFRLGPHHPTSHSGWSWASTDGRNRVYMRSNGKIDTWARIGASTWISADCGLRHSAGVRSDGTLWTWGDNGWGQLGHGDQMSRSVPTQVGTDANWAQVSCGWANTVAVKTNGTLWIWGLNAHNQLGENTGGHRLVPKQMGTDTNWEQAWFNTLGGVDGNQAPGVLAKKTTGTIWGWGWNGWYIVGDGTGTQRATPTQGGNAVSTWRNIFVSHQGGHYAGIRTDNSLWFWGLGGSGKQGRGNTTDYSTPTQVGTTEWSWVALGRNFSIAIKTNGTLWAAGWGGYGHLGDNTGIERQTFVQIGTDTNWSRCYAAWNTAYVTKTTGGLWAMGMGISGQMGDGAQSQYWQPVQVSTLNFNHNYPIRGCEQSMMLVTNTGELYVAGTNKMFQMGLSVDSGFNWGTSDFSMEFWYRRNYDSHNLASDGLYTNFLFDARSYFTDRVDGNKNEWAIKNNHNNNNIEIILNNVSELMDRTNYGAASIANWQHYVWQRVNGVMALYANGRKVDEKFYPYNIIAHGNSITVGSGTTPYLHYSTGLQGLISDIRINRGTAAYAADGGNPEIIPVPKQPLTAINGTVFLTASGPGFFDYSGTSQFYNDVRSDGNIDEENYYRDYTGIYVMSYGPYVHDINSKQEHNDITGLIRPYGDSWDGTNQSQAHSYHITPANQYPEYAWITRMVKPWTIEFWMWGHQSVQYYNSVTNHRKLYTATSAGHNGWEVWYGQANATSSGTTVNNTWGHILFRLWTANDSAQQIFGSNSSRPYRAHSWNHVAVVYNPAGVNKMGIFMNGERVGSRISPLTGSTKVWNTYFLQNDATGIAGIRISDNARYNPDLTTYTVPINGYVLDNNTVTCINGESALFQVDFTQGQLDYSVRPDFRYKKFGKASYRFHTLDQSNGVVERMYWAENSWRYYNLDMRMRDITMECWCSWWDAALGSIQFNGTQGLRLPTSGTLNPTNGSIEFWIKASTSQPANPIIFGGNGATTSAVTINSGRIEFTVRRGGTHNVVTSETSVTDNQWHHVVCVKYEQSATRADGFIYVDGKLEGKSVTWAGSNALSFSSGTIGSNFNGLLCNFHFTTYNEKYMSSWNRLGTALHQGYTTATYNPIPVNYHNPALSELDTTSTDTESGKYPVPNAALSRGNNTVLLLNAENVSIIQSPVGVVGSITGSGPWTATITGMSSTTGLVIGSALFGATNGTGSLFGGTPTSVIVASVPSGTSITYTVTGGSAPTAGTITDIRTPGQVKDDSSNNWSIVPSINLPSRSAETPFYSGGSLQDFAGRPARGHESGYGSTLFHHSGGPHVWRTEEGNWAFTISSDFMYDIYYPRRYFTIRTNTRVRNMSEGDSGWQHVALSRVNQNWILYIDGVEVGRMAASYHGSSDRPIYTDNISGDYSTSYVALGSHYTSSWWRSWTGCIQDFRVSSIARYDTKVINSVPTMVHRGTMLPALPTSLHPVGM